MTHRDTITSNRLLLYTVTLTLNQMLMDFL